MKLFACLCWYEEPPANLVLLVSSLSRHVDHLVAVDGAYWGFPGANTNPASDPTQAQVLQAATSGIGIGLTLIVPNAPWAGGEPEKRTAMFAAARASGATPDDWLLIIDGDERVSDWPSDLRGRLADSPAALVAEVRLWERLPTVGDVQPPGPLMPIGSGHRALYRSLPDLRVEGAHYVNVAGHGTSKVYLRGRGDLHDLDPALDCHDLRIEHRRRHRSDDRLRMRDAYTDMRERLGLERITPLAHVERA